VLSTARLNDSDSYCVNGLVRDMGVPGFIAWMNGHVQRVSHLVTEAQGSRPRSDTGTLRHDLEATLAEPSWPPSPHHSVTWSDLSLMEQHQVTVFLKAGRGAVLEVPTLATRARGVQHANRHDYEAAKSLDERSLTEKAGRTGRRLVAVPRGMP